MRHLQSNSFDYGLAEALTSWELDAPDEEAEEALKYIQQFIIKRSNSAELIEGYISEDYVDALVRVRDNNSVKGISSAVEAIGADGKISEKVDKDSDFRKIEIKATEENINNLKEENISSKNIQKSLFDVLWENRGNETISYFMPEDTYKEVNWDNIT